MTREVDITITPDKLFDEHYIINQIYKVLKIKRTDKLYYKIIRKSIDARKRPKYLLRLLVGIGKKVMTDGDKMRISYKQNSKGKKVLIIGAGPAGYFAALECLELGLVPIVIERGKDVRARRRDLKSIQQDGVVNPESNYCFGEGGAGTYSDGKLYTRSKKRGDILKTLKILVNHGAQSDILSDAHPHIGSNKLPEIISKIRETIETFGGQVLFDSKVTDFLIDGSTCHGVVVNGETEHKGDYVILATGHSARDIFKLLDNKGVRLESKPFALGIRIEHPQPLIDELQYKSSPREANLPAASYSLVTQVKDIGVFSFCMCPGGLIVPAATEPGEIVVNGMSLSRRDSPYANSGIVTALSTEELESQGYAGTFGAMEFQRDVEQRFFNNGDGSQMAPAQNLIDFVNAKEMLPVGESSYIPGLYAAPVHELLPDFIYERLRDGLLAFSLKMPGYFTQEAKVVGVESRTSSPIRIPRDPETLSHPQVDNLFPCGEGAGFAGGILSAAMDGQRVVKAIHKNLS